MTSIADASVKIQTTSESNPSTPAWFGEIVLLSSFLRKHGVLNQISEQVRFARRRFGRYEVIDFLALLAGLCDQWGAHPGGVLREPPALRGRERARYLTVTTSLLVRPSPGF